MRVRGLAAVCTVLFAGLFAGLLLAACNKKLTADAAGTVRLMLTADVKLKTVVVIAYSKDGSIKKLDSVDVSKDDLQKPGVEEDINTGDSFKTGEVMFVGVGYDTTGLQLASGSATTTFVPGQIVVVNLAMTSGVVDADQDGDPAETDCNDNNSMQNHFMNELCTDDIDNNCDGSVNEGCACSGDPRACYSFDPSTRGLGKCRDGTQACTNGLWATCAGAIGPDPETCDSIDNNCDGSVDEGCNCTAGDQRYCNNNQVTTTSQDVSALQLKGLCVAGTQACKNSIWGKCTGAVTAVAETCDGEDNDCDGVIDNGFDLDGDGYTTCGTLHAACDDTVLASGTPSPLIPGTPTAQFIDCDDANPARHPCQSNHCDDTLDLNCTGQLGGCQSGLSCADTPYYDGQLFDDAGPGEPVCYLNAATYDAKCGSDHVSCTGDPSICASTIIQGTKVAFTRSTCHDAAGCSGTTGPGQGAVITGASPFTSDCNDSTACSGFIEAAWVSGTCAVFGGATSGHGELPCTGTGACGDFSSSTAVTTSCASVATANRSCSDQACRIDTACATAGTQIGSPYCYSETATPASPTGIGSGCRTAGNRCWSNTDGATDASCVLCNATSHCGDTCMNCGGASACCAGVDSTQKCQTASTDSAHYGCICNGTTDLNTVAFYCPTTNSCCAANEYCGVAGCATPAGGQIACGSSTYAENAYWCNVGQFPPTATPVTPVANMPSPCNQATCDGNHNCSDIPSSTCASCTGGGAFPCWTACCSTGQTCSFNSTGGLCCDTGHANCGTVCCASGKACTNAATSTCAP